MVGRRARVRRPADREGTRRPSCTRALPFLHPSALLLFFLCPSLCPPHTRPLTAHIDPAHITHAILILSLAHHYVTSHPLLALLALPAAQHTSTRIDIACRVQTLQLVSPTNTDTQAAKIGGSQALQGLILCLQQEQAKKQLMLLDHLTDAAHYTMATSNNFMPSPTEMMDTNAPNQYFASSHYNDPAKGNAQAPIGFGNPFAPTPIASIPTTPGSVAGRKRSRGDTLGDEDDLELDGSLPTPASDSGNQPRGEPIMGPGMTLIYPGDPSYPMSAESQSGTWVEEQQPRMPPQVAELRRPSIPSRKSQRMDHSSSGADELAQLVLPPNMREATAEPLIDEATRKLGISWTRMDSNEHRQISQAAYAKFIVNHYPALREVKVWFENAALPGYLVQCLNVYSGETEFYLFSSDLTEARLVTRDASQLIPRLNMLPALHLAAPGGQITANMSPVTIAQNEVSNYVKKEVENNGILRGRERDYVFPSAYNPAPVEPQGICAAHSMEVD